MRLAIRSAAFLLVSLLAPACTPPTPPSVLLVTLDTTRADHLSCYGNGRIRTPALDQVASRGTLFENARTCVPITLPAHVSLLTGTYPYYHGVRDNATTRLAPAALTISERFRDRGYRTAAFVASYVLDRQFGLDQGFDHYDQVPVRRLVAEGALEERRGDQVVDATLAWLEQSASPFFAWVHLFDPHAPYEPPSPYSATYAAHPYDGEIAFADRQVGRLLAALQDRGELKNTFVVITADHGESLGEHGEQTHTIFVYDATLRIPLLISGPGIARGRRLSTPTSLVDVAPTLLELAGLDPLPAAQGVSVAPLLDASLSPAAPSSRGDRLIYFESCAGWLNYGWSPLVGLTDGRIKLIEAPRPELYELTVDPGEQSNTLTFTTADVADWRRSLRRLWQPAERSAPPRTGDASEPSTPADRNASRPPSEGKPRADAPHGWAVAHPIRSEETRKLERLGYPAGGRTPGPIPFPDPTRPDPKDRIAGQALRERALDLLRRGRTDRAALVDAISLLQVGLRDDPQNAVLADYLGTALGMQGRWADAVEILQRSLERSPWRSEARFNMAYCLARMGRRPEAIAEAQLCLQARPGFAKAAEWIARWSEQEGDIETAIKYWSLFIDLWQGDPGVAQEARAEIQRLGSNR